jgi:hypothetical protein
MSLAIGLWVRDTALRLRQQGMDMNRSLINGISRVSNDKIYTSKTQPNETGWSMKLGQNNDKQENLTWLL